MKIGLFGKRGSGKSALINAMIGRDLTEMSETKESIYKAMDIKGLGKVTLVDTVGIDAKGKRMTNEETEIALMLIANDSMELELAWMNRLMRAGTKVIAIVSQIDKMPDEGRHLAAAVKEASGKTPIRVSAKMKIGLEDLHREIINLVR